MKKIVYLFIFIFLTLALSASTLAVDVTFPVSGFPNLTNVLKGSDGHYTFDVVTSRKLSNEQKVCYQQLIDTLAGRIPGRVGLVHLYESGGSGLYRVRIDFFSFDKSDIVFGVNSYGIVTATVKDYNMITFYSFEEADGKVFATDFSGIGNQNAPSGTISLTRGPGVLISAVCNPFSLELPSQVRVLSNVKSILPNMAFPVHLLNINYVYENGKEASPMYKGSFEQGADFSVPSPAISGYIPSIATISGVMGDTDLAYTVTYKQIKHTLTIQYQYEDGVQAHESYTAQLAEGEPFRVDVPVIDGYKPSINVFTGQMVNIDLNYTVTYTKIEDPEDSSSSEESSSSSGGSSSGSGGDSSGGSSSGGGSSGDASNIDNPYIVWNPTLVSAGFKQMKQQAGKAFNAGIWVFLMITGIILVAKLVKDLAH